MSVRKLQKRQQRLPMDMEGVECCSCGGVFPADGGTRCSPVVDAAERHFMCHECLCGHIRNETNPEGVLPALFGFSMT